jgi:hypothetical protein
MNKLSIMIQTVFIVVMAFAVSAVAKEVMKTATVGDMRIELHVLPAEPFFTASEVAAKKVKSGMLIIGGAEPMSLEANANHNRHLVVHIYDAGTNKAITDAKVSMNFQQLDAKGKPMGTPVDVPVVVMEAIGKGVESTHYGNNVVMPAGSYSVSVMVDDKRTDFQVMLSDDATTSSVEMHMH